MSLEISIKSNINNVNGIDYNAQQHAARVIAGSGSVPNLTLLDKYVKLLKQAGLWDSCVFFAHAGNGVDKDGNQDVGKVYDLMSNADLAQGTQTAKPKYNSDGTLLYDGGDKIQSANLTDTNPIDLCRSAITVTCWVNIVNAGYQFIFNRYDTGGAGSIWYIVQRATGVLGVGIFKGISSGIIKVYDTTATIEAGWRCLGFTYSTSGGLNLYIDGINQEVTKTTDNANSDFVASTIPLTVGARYSSTLNPYLNGNKTALPQIYNKVLTDAEILWNYNNIKPVSNIETYGTLTGTHIDRVDDNFGQVLYPLKAQSIINNMVANGTWDSLGEAWIPEIGLLKDTNSATSKLYGLKGLHDLAQATGTAQPLYSNDALVFDGIDDTLTKTLTKAEVLGLTLNGDFTLQIALKLPQLANGVTNMLMSMYYLSANNFAIRVVGRTDNKLQLQIYMSANASQIISQPANFYSYTPNDILQITIQYTASTGATMFYINETSFGAGNNALGDINNFLSANYTMSLFRQGTTFDEGTLYGLAFFRGILTPAQCKLEV